MTGIDRRRALQWIPLAALGGCAMLQGHDPVQVVVVGLEPLPSEGFELRFLIKLRVQNPNATAIAYDGIYVELDVRGDTLASGVSDAVGSVPRFGEAVLSLPVTISTLRLARQALSIYMGSEARTIDYVLRGKISGPAFSAVRFESRGQMSLGAGGPAPAEPPP